MVEHKVKITVLKKLKTGDVLKEYGASTVEAECPVVKEGVEYISTAGKVPDGFCASAWADIRKDILTVAMGANMPGIRQPGTVITGCTDWFRPVIFKVERISND